MQILHVVTVVGAWPAPSMQGLHQLVIGMQLAHQSDQGSAAEGHSMHILHRAAERGG